MDKAFLKKLIPVLMTNSVVWFFGVVFVPLGFMYNDFPGQDNLVMLAATIPSLVCMVAGLAAVPMMRCLNKKTVVLIGLACSVIGGLLIRFFGMRDIWVCIAGSAVTGVPAGIVAAANYAVLAEISPDNMRDKVCGWGDACCTLGMMVANFLAGLLCADGRWIRAYDVYFIAVAVFVLAIFLYPSVPSVATTAVLPGDEDRVPAVSQFLPPVIVGLIAVKFVSGFFYKTTTLYLSDYVINETQMGNSVLVGTATTLFSFVAIFGALLIFAWIKLAKGNSITISLLVYAVLLYLIPHVKSPIAVVVLTTLCGLAEVTNFSTSSTLVTMSAPARSVELASSLFVSLSFLGEFVGGYAPKFLAQLFLGSEKPSSCYLVAAVGLAVVALIALPFCRRAYALAFGNKEE